MQLLPQGGEPSQAAQLSDLGQTSSFEVRVTPQGIKVCLLRSDHVEFGALCRTHWSLSSSSTICDLSQEGSEMKHSRPPHFPAQLENSLQGTLEQAQSHWSENSRCQS